MRLAPFAWVALTAASSLFAGDALAEKTRADYRYFRELSVDLTGRIPTREELTAFESPGFDVDKWIDASLDGPAYAERIRRIYQDLMRMEVNAIYNYLPGPILLRRATITGPDGKPLDVYGRVGQRRTRQETSYKFCLTPAETGLEISLLGPPEGSAQPVSQAALDANTRLVKPWWLYQDYRSANPSSLYGSSWTPPQYSFEISASLTTSADMTPTTAIRVCNEEASEGEVGTVAKRFAGENGSWNDLAGKPFDCNNMGYAEDQSTDCGCGVGLERCHPVDGFYNGSTFRGPSQWPLGFEQPLAWGSLDPASWQRMWWAQEFNHFFDHIMTEDRDFRELLTARYSVINGPLAQFYRGGSTATLGYLGEGGFGYVDPEPLFDPKTVPAALMPFEVSSWQIAEDRGVHASGFLTMPIFLLKYGTRRARAHLLWNVFACKDFLAENSKLPPSEEVNLTKRPGCQSCHQTLEPLAAYFSRVEESSWLYLPEEHFPVDNPQCEGDHAKEYSCSKFYDPAFATPTSSQLGGAYASIEHAKAGPPAFAEALVSSPDFSTCVVKNVAEGFLGRRLTPDDDAYKQTLAKTFADGGFKMKALVRAVVKSDAYRTANDLSATTWREQGGSQ